MIADQHPDAAMTQPADDGLDIVYGDWIDAGKWFIEHHEIRARDQCPGDFEPSPFAPGECVGLAVSKMFDAQLIEKCLEPLPAVVGRQR